MAKILGKEKLKDMRNFRAMKQELSAAKDSISKIETKDLPKSYAGWVKNSYRTDVGVTVGADGKVTAKDGLTSLRKVLYVRDKVETANDIVNFGDTMATGHGVLYHQDNGKDWQTQVWDKTTGSDDEPPTWVSAPLDVLGVG